MYLWQKEYIVSPHDSRHRACSASWPGRPAQLHRTNTRSDCRNGILPLSTSLGAIKVRFPFQKRRSDSPRSRRNGVRRGWSMPGSIWTPEQPKGNSSRCILSCWSHFGRLRERQFSGRDETHAEEDPTTTEHRPPLRTSRRNCSSLECISAVMTIGQVSI